MKAGPRTVIHAGAIRDAQGVEARPGSVAIETGKIVYAGCPEGLPEGFGDSAQVAAYPDHLLLPAMANAHTHLELTDIGPRPYDPAGGFVGWVKMLRKGIAADFVERRESAGRGAERTRASGVQAVGDIASSIIYAVTRKNRGVLGQTYAELFGIDPSAVAEGLPSFLPPHEAEAGLQPHAPYSAGPALYAAAASTGRPVSTHLAETQEETRFVAHGDGPWLDYLKSLGKWDAAFAAYYGQGLSPVQWMQHHLEAAAGAGGWLVAHCNYVSDEDIAILADTNTSVAYCPIASEYFGHTDHRYRDMLDAGVNVCLGTDSIVCADPDDPQPLGLLSAMRRLYQRDKTDPAILLRMATVNGAKALRQPRDTATLAEGAPAKFAFAAFDPADPNDAFAQVLKREEPASGMFL